ncbi:MAG: hypothetical protein KAH06_04660 [Desulfobacterales bacterium]|nr:hypothetical protein [Desulfobacterales bacterium]
MNEQEVCVIIPEKHYEHQAVLTLHSLFSMIMMPNQPALDFADVKSTVSRKSGVMVHTVSSYENSLSAFKHTLDTYKIHIKNSNALLLHFMYDEDVEYSLSDICNIGDTISSLWVSGATHLWSCSPDLKLDADFRSSLFISMNNNLMADLNRATKNLSTLYRGLKMT